MICKSFLTVIVSLLICLTTFAQVNDDTNGRLWQLAKVWGLAKYYHPENCATDWNQLLLHAIDSVLVSTSNVSFNDAVGEMLQAAGPVPHASIPLVVNGEVNINAKFDWIDSPLLNQQNQDNLDSIAINFRPVNNCLVQYNDQTDPVYVGYLSFKNDNLLSLASFNYSQERYRLLALFYFWNVINYYNPYNDLLDQDWDTTLLQFIPLFRESKNDTTVHILFRNLATYLDDSHAITSSNITVNYFGPNYPLIKLELIENQSVVTKLGDSLSGIAVGDIVKTINGVEISVLLDSFARYIPASNSSSQQRDLHVFVLRGPAGSVMDLELENASGATYSTTLMRDAPASNYFQWKDIYTGLAWNIIQCGYGYVNMQRLVPASVPLMYQYLKNTPAIIFDIRNYPNGTLWTLLPYLLSEQSTWALLTIPDFTFPGWYNWHDNQLDAGQFSNPTPYNGKVIILANAETQSQAEYTVMGLQQHPNAFTIGSQTAGADGNISNVRMPGGLNIFWTTLGVYYPDTSGTQRVGIRIDTIVQPTIEDIRQGRDRVLMAALDCLTSLPEDYSVEQGIEVYPNPASDVFYINYDASFSGLVELEVTNAIGQVVYRQRVNENGIRQVGVDVSGWNDGIYVVCIRGEMGVMVSGKIQVMH